MREARRAITQRIEYLNLRGGVGDVILASDHIRNAEVNIVAHAAQRIKKPAILANQNRVRDRSTIDCCLAPDAVNPAGTDLVQPETPVRLAALGLKGGAILVAQGEGGAVIDGGASGLKLCLALEAKFCCRLIGRIEPARRAQIIRRLLVSPDPRRLALIAIPVEAQPFQISPDRINTGLFGAFSIRVVDTQNELPASLAGKKSVEECGPQIANVQFSRW